MKKQKKRSLREALRDWDMDRFDLDDEIIGDLHPASQNPEEEDLSWKTERITAIDVLEEKTFRKLYPVFSILLAGVLVLFLIRTVFEMPEFNRADSPANTSEVIERYIESGLTETGAVNIVAGIILDYRAFDTLGESHVLFTAVIAVMVLILKEKEEEESEEESNILHRDIVVRNTARLLTVFILIFGIYVVLNGHLGPGGGFSGGAIMGSALILYASALDQKQLSRVINMRSYSYIIMAALLFYSLSKCYSFYTGANGLHSIFTPGTPGMILSAGLILPLNIAVGIVVACTMYGFYAIFTRGRI